MNRQLAADHLVPVLPKGAHLFAHVEQLTHSRLLAQTHSATMGRVNGSLLVLSRIRLMAPLPLPFSNTLPAYAALFLAWGSLELDGYVVMAGYVMVLLTLGTSVWWRWWGV